MKLHDLLKSLYLLGPFPGGNPEISSVENNHRKVREGSLFICIKGYTADGHDFAPEAVERGAVAIVSERKLEVGVPVVIVPDTTRAKAILADAFYGHPSKQFHLTGITGTNGKTTTSHLIERIFADAGSKTGLIGTMYTKIGDVKLETKNTTPESLVLQKTFRKMADSGVKHAVMEVSSHALDLGRVHGTDFNVAVFTNLTQDHLDYHKTMDRYKYAKSLLFSQLGNTYSGTAPKFAILNADDAATVDFIRATAAHVLTYGIDKKADLRAVDIVLSPQGTAFTLETAGRTFPVKMKQVGKFNVYNALAAIGAAAVSGISLEDAIRSLERIKGVAGRFELVNAGQDFTIIVDYAHTPDSLENVLATIREFAEKDIYVIAGCGGNRDSAKRPLMAKIACDYATNPILTSDNPRNEDPIEILRDMEKGVQGRDYKVIPDRKEAIEFAVNEAKTGDVILIAGKGHETYQEIKGIKYDFDDRVIARNAVLNKA
ncbi:UDP-N-acetylmuramoyl-L-alanyl-D-glutamate--2,6-diaminopimelate ligase [Neobacillus notoginsengisoli]|uniref:UDP-N-acetylmuramoyl-L-alanyl-D-glutamate--2,6-diaminopimelate ligase n=1 Tax=Neobacillus notoginsengisoli TaxID=1578198 RepID=A0A417YQV5_9BACI|nr:UDP-N-acetylmuramoyl-L-alanyl-D-glutamate--2,6-diaminopimelate ligase [Neobacillus notoginsengisoli]RHW36501.1 UDP-N-acetylmuramoyl-L-alanyl-D-glutamate--2,6-diaminopimelate ligase [Neobacillus notoginsengisoli]